MQPVAVLQLIHLPAIQMLSSRSFQDFIDENDELYFVLKSKWEKNTWYTKLSALPRRRAMDVYTWMSDGILTRYNYIEDGYRKRFREVKLIDTRNAKPVSDPFEELT